MFQSFYRILDRFDQKVYALAIFTGESTRHIPNQFSYQFHGTSLNYLYNTYYIASQSEKDLLQSKNPFAIAVLAGLYVLRSKNDVDIKYRYRLRLMRLLLQDKIRNNTFKRECIHKLLSFIEHLLRLPDDMDIKLLHDIKPIIEKEDTMMGLSLNDTSIARFFRKEGKEEGEKQKAIEIALKLISKGETIEEVSSLTGLSIEEVKLLSEKNQA